MKNTISVIYRCYTYTLKIPHMEVKQTWKSNVKQSTITSQRGYKGAAAWRLSAHLCVENLPLPDAGPLHLPYRRHGGQVLLVGGCVHVDFARVIHDDAAARLLLDLLQPTARRANLTGNTQ